ncbi:sulfotransferase [Shimia abyssi]|uniref:Tetratricopeptide repeat protein n=1 Tax=Shimia abyssi TaxID=1662395 RepID=A0A2P8FCR4_9RHOB|nr:sulfotransferase [Shimia abyssi]PSL19472.1 tetratricopeptide repeat protein [Shimia abyssi]
MSKTFKLSERLRVATVAEKAGQSRAALEVYQSILERFPGNAKAKAGVKRLSGGSVGLTVDAEMDAVAARGPQLNAALGRISGISDPLAMPESVKRAAPVARGAHVPDSLSVSQMMRQAESARAQRNYADALALYRRVLQVEPENEQAIWLLGLVHHQIGESAVAISTLEGRTGGNIGAICTLAHAYREQGRYDEAIAAFESALERAPHDIEARVDLGDLLAAMGRKEDAIANYEAAIELKPEAGLPYLQIAGVKTFQSHEPLVKKMQSVVQTEKTPLTDKAQIHFALGKALGDSGALSESFENYSAANKLMHDMRPFDMAAHRALLTQIKRPFEADGFARLVLPELRNSPVKPVFIVGMPRSGSSLIEQVLDSHSEVHAAGEIGYLSTIMQRAVSEFAQRPVIFDKALLHDIRDAYLGKLQTSTKGARVITDKNLLNFRYLGVVLAAFPEASVINMVRDPMAICWSIYRHHFAGELLSFAYDAKDIAAFFNSYTDIMAFWRKRFPGRIFDLDYDAFTRDPEQGTRHLLDRCGLAFETGCLDFHENRRAANTASMSQVRQRVYQGSSQEWRRYEAYLGDLKVAIGYGQ